MKFDIRLAVILLPAVVIAGCGPNEAPPMAATSTTSTLDGVSPWIVGAPFVTADQPVSVVERDPSDPFLFVVERKGTIRTVSRTTAAMRTVLDISKLTTTDSERGLLGLAFLESANGVWFGFVNYTNLDGNTIVAGYTVDSAGGFIENSRRKVLQIHQPYANHNGGGMVAGPNGMLYISTGDGGSGGDPHRNAQDLKSLLGKILRINPFPAEGAEYSIPVDNPFVDVPDARPEIWSFGLRNPWRFTFDDRAMWIADVGQSTWEEINFVPGSDNALAGRGVNFGWSGYEGLVRFNKDQVVAAHTKPIYVYQHDQGRCSIIGGAVVRDQIPELSDWYLYSDFCTGKIYGLTKTGSTYMSTELSESLGKIVAVDATSDGIYAVDIDGAITKLRFASQ